jgi:hypothetical protein
MRNSYKISVGKLEEKRLLRRPVRGWKDNFEKYFCGLDLPGQNMIQWWVLVKNN